MRKDFSHKLGNLNDDVKKWVSHVVAGAALIDGEVDSEEKPYLMKILESLFSTPEDLYAIEKILQAREVPPIPQIEAAPEIAENALKCILDISASDNEITGMELEYILKAAEALGMDYNEARSLIRFTFQRMRTEYFYELLCSLNKEERFWLAVVIFKSVHVDEYVHEKEIPYLNDIYRLLEGDMLLINNVRNMALQSSLNDLPKVKFDEMTTRRILRYLLEITMIDSHFAEIEIEFIRQIAEVLKFDPEDLAEIKRTVEIVLLDKGVKDETPTRN